MIINYWKKVDGQVLRTPTVEVNFLNSVYIGHNTILYFNSHSIFYSLLNGGHTNVFKILFQEFIGKKGKLASNMTPECCFVSTTKYSTEKKSTNIELLKLII